MGAVLGSLGQNPDDALKLCRGNTYFKRRAAALLAPGAAVAFVVE